jgi:alkylhydroperoxidase family enzyme
VRTASGKQEGVSEDLIAQLDKYQDGPFTTREKAALRLSEVIALAPHSLDDAFYAELCRHFTPGQIVQLGIASATFLGLGRFVAAFRVPLKEESQDWPSVTTQ